jgi:hypothetical protein
VRTLDVSLLRLRERLRTIPRAHSAPELRKPTAGGDLLQCTQAGAVLPEDRRPFTSHSNAVENEVLWQLPAARSGSIFRSHRWRQPFKPQTAMQRTSTAQLQQRGDFYCGEDGDISIAVWQTSVRVLTPRGAFATLEIAACLDSTPDALPVPKWRNWQTRMVQVHVLARVWRFKSSLRHHEILGKTHRPGLPGLCCI